MVDTYNRLLDQLEHVDASVFSGELLWNANERALLAEYAERWLRAIAEHEKAERAEQGTPNNREDKTYLLAEHCDEGGFLDVLSAASADDIRNFFRLDAPDAPPAVPDVSPAVVDMLDPENPPKH